MRLRTLIIGKDGPQRTHLGAILDQQGVTVSCTSDASSGLSYLKARTVDVLFSDLDILNGVNVLREARFQQPTLPIIATTDCGSVESTIEAFRSGAIDYLTKPFQYQRVLVALKRAIPEWQAERNEIRESTNSECIESATISVPGLKSKAWKENCQQIARSSKPILIVGELGVGKENTARMIHSLSAQVEEPFVKVNCEALQESLCKEMFFGKGDTDNLSNDEPNDSYHKGFIESAGGGALFLHNCQCLPKWMQLELTEAARSGYFKRREGNQLIPFRARLIASTRQDPYESIESESLQGEFCNYFAANTLKVPPLRERRQEIQGLLEAQAYEASLDPSLSGCRHELTYTEDALRMLENYDWPGNLYELSGFVRRVLVFVNEPVVTAEIVRKTLPLSTCNLTDPITIPFVPDLKQIQRAIVAEVIKRTQGNKAAAARLLNLHRKALYRLIKNEPKGQFQVKRSIA